MKGSLKPEPESPDTESKVFMSMITEIRPRLVEALRNEEGQGLVEYALILLFVSIVAIVVIVVLGPGISSDIIGIANSL